MKEKVSYLGKYEHLPDTVVDGIQFKRLLLNRQLPHGLVTSYCFFRCDKVGNVFTKDTALSSIIGCPLTRILDVPQNKEHNRMLSEFIPIRDSLTTNEKAIFSSWAKNNERHRNN